MTAGDTFSARLAALRDRLREYGLDQLYLFDGILEELEAAVQGTASPGVESDPELVDELRRTVERLGDGYIGSAPGSQTPRVRFVEVLRRASGGGLPPEAGDPADPFGAELRTMLVTDAALRATLGPLLPLAVRATSVTPSGRWLDDARAAIAVAPGGPTVVAEAVRRVLAALVRAEVVSRPDLLVGGIRPANQRLARSWLWLATVALDAPAELLGAVGRRMGTSGRSDAVVRDTALANTCAALLGASTDPGAAAELASMRARVTNRNVLKQVDRALEVVAGRTGRSVEDVVALALPTFGLDVDGRLDLSIDGVTATVAVAADGTVHQAWRTADGRTLDRPPPGLAEARPAEVADVAERLGIIRAAVVEERRRMEDRLASSRTWPEPLWRSRYADHPIGRVFGRRLIWWVGAPGEAGTAGLPDGDGWIGVDGDPLIVGAASVVRLWHPADADEAEIAAWRATVAAAALEQPLKQAHREVFRPLPRDLGLAADRRLAGRVVEHRHLRSLLRSRGWAVPALGAWDQGDEATAFRDFDDGLRAELRYQAVEQLPTGELQERVRLVAVRFVETSGAPAAPAGADPGAGRGPATRTLADVPPRVFSEALRDVSLVAVVAGEARPD
jgi:plasmid stability protein